MSHHNELLKAADVAETEHERNRRRICNWFVRYHLKFGVFPRGDVAAHQRRCAEKRTEA